MPSVTFDKFGFGLKRFFFDRARINAMFSEGELKILRKLGGFIRKVARNSMKRKGAARKRPKNRTGAAFRRWIQEKIDTPASLPGSPPNCHSGDENASLKKILFAYDGDSSAVVGPVRLHQRQFVGGMLRAGTVPKLMEFGGRVGIREKLVAGTWVPRGRRKPSPSQPVRVRMANYPARPFMAPAVKKSEGKFTEVLTRSIAS